MVPARAGEFVGKHGGSRPSATVRLVRVRGEWSLRLASTWQGAKYETTFYLLAPTFPGPVVAATWLAVELASGPVSYVNSAKGVR